MKIAFITPYYKEDAQVIERCIKSVEAQTLKCDHFLVSDGFPQGWISTRVARHIQLGRCHEDYGNTPRGLGAQLAACEGYDAIGLLDADCWLDPQHAEVCLKTAIGNFGSPHDCDYIVAKRRFVRPDLVATGILEEADHVDTNCFFMFRGAFGLLPVWNLMPKEFANSGDRVFYRAIKAAKLDHATNKTTTVNYLNLWAATYEAAGEPVPEGAKPNVDCDRGYRWLEEQSKRSQTIVKRLVGIGLQQ